MTNLQAIDSVARTSSVLSLVAVLFLVGSSLTGGSSTSASQTEWVLPAAFTGDGAVTIGCQLWDVPAITPYGSLNPDVGFAAGSFSPDEFLAIIDGPHGSATLHGRNCGVSVDWRRFPTSERPLD